jgi:hypothetical protein
MASHMNTARDRRRNDDWSRVFRMQGQQPKMSMTARFPARRSSVRFTTTQIRLPPVG